MRGNPRETQLSDAERVKGELAGLTQRPPNEGAPPSFSRGGDAPLGSQRKAGSLCPRVDGVGGGSSPQTAAVWAGRCPWGSRGGGGGRQQPLEPVAQLGTPLPGARRPS